MKGIGDKTAAELVATYGSLDEILARAGEIKKKRPREALLEHGALARLSKELVTIRQDLAVELDLDAMRIKEPDRSRLKDLYLELEFHTLAKEAALLANAGGAGAAGASVETAAEAEAERRVRLETNYTVVDTLDAMHRMISRAREAGTIAIDTETVIDPDSPQQIDALRSSLVSISIAVAPGEAYYLPLRHRPRSEDQGSLLLDAAGDRSPTDAAEDRGLVRGGDDPLDASALTDATDAGAAPDEARTARKKPVRKKSASSAPELLSIAARSIAAGVPAPRNLPPIDSPEMRPLVELLEDESVKKTAQNAKYDILTFRRAGIMVRGLDFDTMLASYVLDPGRRSHGLDVLALEFLDHTMTSFEDLCGKGKSFIPFDEVPVACASEYSCEDADMTLRLRAVFEPQLEAHHLLRLLQEIEVPLIGVLAEMEWTGISIDVSGFAELKQRFRGEREAVEQQIYKEAGMEFNINSNPQLREILFDKLGLPVLKRTASGPSTDASVLQQLAEEGHALPTLLMEYRELSKLESTYLDALPRLVNPRTGRLHTSFSQTTAATGRLSSNDPNLQNIPIRRELGRDIRRRFVPRDDWMFVAADYSQIELRILAHLSRDPAFVQAFQDGGDIHRQTAAIIFEVPLEEVTSEMRGRAKTINFATIYGQGPHALSRQLRIPHAEARAFIDTYFERFQGIRQYLDAMVDFARSHGYVETFLGRRRYIPELRDRNFNIRAFGERAAANSPIQGSAADLIKVAMIRIDQVLRESAMRSRMLLQVHDELVFEVPATELETMKRTVKHEMEHAAELSVPLVVDLGIGRNWLETKLG